MPCVSKEERVTFDAMRCIPLNNEYPTVYFGYVDSRTERLILKDPIFLLIEEVIDYSLRHHKLTDWSPPLKLDVARKMNKFTYFNEKFAQAVVSPDTEKKALDLARSLGFDEENWLNIKDCEGRRCLEDYLLEIYDCNSPCLSEMFSFACYASRRALEEKRDDLVYDVVFELLDALRIVLPNDEYLMDYYFISNECNDQDINDIDKGDGVIVKEKISEGCEKYLSWILIDPILLFVIELINYSLRLDNLHSWISIFDFGEVSRTEMTYFTENLGKFINRPCAEAEALDAAREQGYDEERWLNLHKTPEERDFHSYIRKVLHYNNDQNELRMFSFVSYSCKLAMRSNRKDLVNEVASTLVCFLCEYYPHEQRYREFDAWACNDVHYYGMQSRSNEEADEENETVEAYEENETVVADEYVENETVETDEDTSYFLWGGTAALAEEDGDSQGPAEKYTKYGSVMDVPEKNSARDTLEKYFDSSAFATELRVLSLKDSAIVALQAEYERLALEEKEGIRTLKLHKISEICRSTVPWNIMDFQTEIF